MRKMTGKYCTVNDAGEAELCLFEGACRRWRPPFPRVALSAIDEKNCVAPTSQNVIKQVCPIRSHSNPTSETPRCASWSNVSLLTLNCHRRNDYSATSRTTT